MSLGLEPGAEAVIRDRVMDEPATGQANQLATSYILAALGGELAVLSAAETGAGGIYDRLEDAGYGRQNPKVSTMTAPPIPTKRRARVVPGGSAE